MASYYVWSGAAAGGNGTTWALAYQTLTLAFAGKAAGDTFYVAHDHAESTAAAITPTTAGTLLLPSKVVCVDRGGSVPPVSADRRATAQVTATANNNITLAGCTHYDGIIFQAGSGTTSSANIIILTTNSTWMRFDNCSLRLGITVSSASTIYVGGSSGDRGATYVEWNNTTVSVPNAGATNSAILFVGIFKWRNTPNALIGGPPTGSLVQVNGLATGRGGILECVGVDLSALGTGKTICGTAGLIQGACYRFIDCKIDPAVTRAVVQAGPGSSEVDFIRCGAAGLNYTVHRQTQMAALNEEIVVVRTGGASDGVTPLSWKIITTANCNYSLPFECPVIAVWNDTVGSAQTATVEGIWGAGVVPNDDECWLDCEFLNASHGSFVHDGKATLLTAAAPQASSSETWGGSTTKFKLSVTFTPQQKGWIYARVKCAKPSSTFYIDPLVTLT